MILIGSPYIYIYKKKTRLRDCKSLQYIKIQHLVKRSFSFIVNQWELSPHLWGTKPSCRPLPLIDPSWWFYCLPEAEKKQSNVSKSARHCRWKSKRRMKGFKKKNQVPKYQGDSSDIRNEEAKMHNSPPCHCRPPAAPPGHSLGRSCSWCPSSEDRCRARCCCRGFLACVPVRSPPAEDPFPGSQRTPSPRSPPDHKDGHISVS